MASSTTRALRADVVTRLQGSSISPLSTTTVYDSRDEPLPRAELPAVIVSTPIDRDEQRSAGQPVFRRVIELRVESHATGASDTAAMTAADQLDEAVRAQLFGDREWLGVWERFARVEVARAVDSTMGHRVAVAVTTVDLECARLYDDTAASADAADLETVQADTYRVGEAPPDDPLLETTITVPS